MVTGQTSEYDTTDVANMKVNYLSNLGNKSLRRHHTNTNLLNNRGEDSHWLTQYRRYCALGAQCALSWCVVFNRIQATHVGIVIQQIMTEFLLRTEWRPRQESNLRPAD